MFDPEKQEEKIYRIDFDKGLYCIISYSDKNVRVYNNQKGFLGDYSFAQLNIPPLETNEMIINDRIKSFWSATYTAYRYIVSENVLNDTQSFLSLIEHIVTTEQSCNNSNIVNFYDDVKMIHETLKDPQEKEFAELAFLQLQEYVIENNYLLIYLKK